MLPCGFFLHGSIDQENGQPDPCVDRLVESYDGFNTYLAITDEFLHYVWVFLVKPKEPPIDIMNDFPARFGNERGGLMHANQGENWQGLPHFGKKY